MNRFPRGGNTIFCTQTVPVGTGKEARSMQEKNRESNQKNAQKEPNEQKNQKNDRK